jgi:hypothetical protein
MQLMPETAKRTARRFGFGFDVARLTQIRHTTPSSAPPISAS